MSCKFIKKFKEPNEKYNCFSLSLFYMNKYIKTTHNLKPFNASKNKVAIFYKNLMNINELLLTEVYPKNFYLRLYYDNSIFKCEKYVELIKILSKNPKIQLVEYICNDYKINNHINLFGTLSRFYTIFDDESKNMNYCIITDADNFFTDNFFNIFNKIEKSKILVYGLNNINQIVFHSNDFMQNDNFYNYIYLIANCVIVKKDKIFNKTYWKKYFDNMFDQEDLMYVFNYLNFKKYSFIKILERNDLKIESYNAFSYGADEIWLNYVIKHILIENNKIDKLGVYLVKDYNFNFILFKLIDMFKFNSITNDQFILFLSECNFLNNKNIDELVNYIHNIKNDNNTLKLFDYLKKNKYLNRLYIQSNIKYTINNYHKLLESRGELKMKDIITSKIPNNLNKKT